MTIDRDKLAAWIETHDTAIDVQIRRTGGLWSARAGDVTVSAADIGTAAELAMLVAVTNEITRVIE